MKSYVGFDVSLAETSVCVLNAGGKVRFEGNARSPRSTFTPKSAPRSPVARHRSRASMFGSRTSAFVCVRMIRVLSGLAWRPRSQLSTSSARAWLCVSAACTTPCRS